MAMETWQGCKEHTSVGVILFWHAQHIQTLAHKSTRVGAHGLRHLLHLEARPPHGTPTRTHICVHPHPTWHRQGSSLAQQQVADEELSEPGKMEREELIFGWMPGLLLPPRGYRFSSRTQVFGGLVGSASPAILQALARTLREVRQRWLWECGP